MIPLNRAARLGLFSVAIIATIAVQTLAKAASPVVAVAKVTPIAGHVNVRLHNDIGDQIVVEVPGYLEPRSLGRGADLAVDVPTPATLKISRANGQLLKIDSTGTQARSNCLTVTIEEASPLSDDSGILRIEPNGQVVLDQ